jgi:hypothetical protein
LANTAAPFGFRQYSGTGSSPTYEQVTLGNGGIDYNATVIYYGDPCTRASTTDGTLIQGLGSGSVIPLAGIFMGCKYLSTAISRTVWSNYWPGGSPVTSANQSTIEAYIVNDPMAQWLVQGDATGVTQAAVGSNFDYIIGTGTAANGISGAALLHTAATTFTFPFRLQSCVLNPPGANGTTIGAYGLAVVAFNNVETKTLVPYNG